MTKHLNRAAKVKKYIKEHGSITSMDAYRDLGITRLSAAILELRQLGVNVKTNREVGRNRDGEKVCYARYEIVEV